MKKDILKKISCYEGLLKGCINAGWKVNLFVIEVVACGYAACSLRSCLSRLGFIQRSVRDIMKRQVTQQSNTCLDMVEKNGLLLESDN